MIVALVPGRVIPPPTLPEFPQPVEPGRQRLAEPNVWPGMQVFLIDVYKYSFIAAALQRTAPDGKVFVASSHPLQTEQLAQQLAPFGAQVEVIDVAPLAALPLADAAIDRVFCAIRRSELSHCEPMLQEVHRVVKPGAQLTVILDFAIGRQARETILHACAAAGFELAASHRRRLQRSMSFRA